jgi:hypothetical protein
MVDWACNPNTQKAEMQDHKFRGKKKRKINTSTEV